MNYNEMIVFWDKQGHVLSVARQCWNVLQLLSKLGLKSAPLADCVMMMTSYVPAGNYTVSYTHNGVVTTSSVTVTSWTSNTIELPIEAPAAEEDERKITREKRRQWRQQAHRHSRNTGLKANLGRRR